MPESSHKDVKLAVATKPFSNTYATDMSPSLGAGFRHPCRYDPEFGSWNSCRGEFIRQINVLQANEFAPTKSRMFIIVLTFYVQLPDLG